jgi:pyridoxamine 5'-phosphate oxidase
MSDLKNIRTDYQIGQLNQSDLNSSPFLFFKQWMKTAVERVKKDPNAFVLSTISESNFPSSRVVLLRGVEKDGFCFFTNYNSEKSQSIFKNNKVSMTFYWPEIERQVRINGIAQKTTSEYSDNYFKSRPYSSKIGAWSSNQSSQIETRDELENKVEFYKNKFPKDVPRPDFWGGFIIVPCQFEFWQGRSNRLHDRFVYSLVDGKWEIVRLAP